MQTIFTCNPLRRSNGYIIYTLCIGLRRSNSTIWGWILHRLLQTVESSYADEGMHDETVNMLQLSTSEVQYTLKDLFRESSGRSKRKWCFAKIPARCDGILWLSSSICTCDIGLVVPMRHFEVLVAEAALPTNSAWLHTLCESSCQV